MILLQYVRSISIDFTNSVIDLNLFVNIYLFAVQPHETLSHLLGNEMQCSLTFFILCKHQSLFIIYLFIIYNNNKKTYMFVYHFNLWQFLWLLQFQYLLIIVMSSFLFADLQPTDQPRQRSCKKKIKRKNTKIQSTLLRSLEALLILK